MFGLLRRLVARPVRVVFVYNDGMRKVHADPLVILRKIEEFGGENWHVLVESAARKPNAVQYAIPMNEDVRRKQHSSALRDVASLARAAFDLKAIAADGSGLTEAEQIEVLAQYLAYVGGLAVKASFLPTSPRQASPSEPSTAA